jgi:hypothetical protein
MVSANRDWDQQRGRLPGAPFDYSIRRLQPADLEGINRVLGARALPRINS